MDTLKPELVWIEGRCYRVNDPTTEVTALQEHDLYENDTTYNDEAEGMDEEEEEFEIVELDNSRFATYFHVSKHYIGSIIGKKGIVKSRLERDTKTSIKIPRQGDNGDIAILGPAPSEYGIKSGLCVIPRLQLSTHRVSLQSAQKLLHEENVRAARRRINMIVVSSRGKQKPTHFLSIPMNGLDIKNNFNIFKEKVLQECNNSRGLEESIFVRAESLHLTMGVMCLMDNEERLLASKLLAEAKEKIVMPILRENLPLKLRLKSLAYMNDDPKQIHVLYGLVSEDDQSKKVIQHLADSLYRYYIKAGLMHKEFGRDTIKLHVTLINTRKRDDNEGDERKKKRESFDGTDILDKFGDYDFGVMDVTEIHLSQLHTQAPDGYYQATCIMKLDNSKQDC